MSITVVDLGSPAAYTVGMTRPKALGYSLQANVKTAEGRQHPDRDAQFGYLNDQVKTHQDEHCPVISVTPRKRNLRHEAPCHIPSTAGRNSEEHFWVQWLTRARKGHRGK